MSLSIKLRDLGMAYRKTKVDLFYSPRLCSWEILEYEKNLEKNLLELKKKIDSGQAPDCGVNSWTLVPKKIKPTKIDYDVIFSDPLKQWKHSVSDSERNSKDKPIAEFRVMEKLPIEFHVFSTLWIQKVGHLFEGKLSDAACGNRLRRKSTSEPILPFSGVSEDPLRQKTTGVLNPISVGSLVPYLYPYRKWRDDGIQVMQDALEEKIDIVTITADVTGFYHNLNVDFMISPDFHKVIGVELDDEQNLLNMLFIGALANWGCSTPQNRGLPVGLTASTVIANVALFELDRILLKEVVPLYYGRYVDDIIIVLKNNSSFTKSTEVWEWIFKRCDASLDWINKEQKKSIGFHRKYLKNSDIIFENSKNKMFILSGTTGLNTVTSILRQIQERASEWRELPDIPDDSKDIESEILSVIKADGEEAESFHKTDKLSVRRAGFAMKLRDIEAYARALPKMAWEKKRHSFLDAFIKHVLALPVFFEYYTYLSRIVQLAANCNEYEHLDKIIEAIDEILTDLDKCKLKVQANNNPKSIAISKQEIMEIFKKELRTRLTQSIEVGLPFNTEGDQKLRWEKFISHPHKLIDNQQISNFLLKPMRLFERDLGYLPFRQAHLPKELTGFPNEFVKNKNAPSFSQKTAEKMLHTEITVGVNSICKMTTSEYIINLPLGFLFPTRPFNLNEIYLIHRTPFAKTGPKDIAEAISAMRGFFPEKSLPKREKNRPIEIPFGKSRDRVRIALANWTTHNKSWIASVMDNPNLTAKRYSRLNKLLNEVIHSESNLDYLILPELSLPARWFMPIAHKLSKKNISLIAGIEYIHRSSKKVESQIWAALSFDGLGFPSMILYRQVKKQAAPREEKELKEYNNIILSPKRIWGFPPIISHAGFHYACLLCSELTNIAYRSSVRGKIDALFVPEWNKDVESFNSIVESAALDIHAYIVQCNNGQYGDSRIRAPYKESWRRDVIRVKGGVNDYFVIGEIDIKALRQFQSCYRSPEFPFKPVPDGFVIDRARETLPKG